MELLQNHPSAICKFYLLYRFVCWRISPQFSGTHLHHIGCTLPPQVLALRHGALLAFTANGNHLRVCNTFNWSLRIAVDVVVVAAAAAVVVESFLSLLIHWNPFFFRTWSRLHQPLSWFHGSQKKHDKSAGAFSWLEDLEDIWTTFILLQCSHTNSIHIHAQTTSIHNPNASFARDFLPWHGNEHMSSEQDCGRLIFDTPDTINLNLRWK